MSIGSTLRAAVASAAAVALAFGAVSTAEAAPTTVDDVTFVWQLNPEVGAGAYMGGCNFLSAGLAGDAGGSRVWAEADGLYRAVDGDVRIVKDSPAGTTEASWATKCNGANGAPVAPGGLTNNAVEFSGGEGTVDLAAGTATVSWDGAFTAVFYGGLSYFMVEDPTLQVNADGTGTLQGTVSGYASSQSDPSKWDLVAGEVLNLATLTGVALTETGITVTPDYLGITNGLSDQKVDGANWGSFPADFVTFTTQLGTGSYWYSSGGAADPRKVVSPLNVVWEVEDAGPVEPVDPVDPGENSGDVDVIVTVPEVVEPVPGALKLSVSGSAALGNAVAGQSGFAASGQLPTVTITDTRDGGTWTANGQLSNFTSGQGSFPASSLGWIPQLISGDAQVGAAVAPNAPGLAGAQTLASGAVGATEISAELSLVAPANTPAGDYVAKLTLTAVG